MEIIFATHNIDKTTEVRQIFGKNLDIKNLRDIACPEIPETSDTLRGNAILKAKYVIEHYGKNCFADDTGLEIEALGNKPGVYSARFAGEGCSYQDNVLKVLREMEGITNRKACFKTVVALILDGKEYLFEGRIDGIITTEQHGKEGFGYDPIFLPDGFDKTFAEMDPATKNRISHRGIAMQKLIEFFKAELPEIWNVKC